MRCSPYILFSELTNFKQIWNKKSWNIGVLTQNFKKIYNFMSKTLRFQEIIVRP